MDTIAVTISNMDKGIIHLWTLDDEACLCGGSGGGVGASWTKVIAVDVGVPLHFVGGLFNNVHLLLDIDGDVILYDLNKKVVSNVTVPGLLGTHEFFKYMKSLFSLKGFKRIKWADALSRLQNSWYWDEEMDE